MDKLRKLVNDCQQRRGTARPGTAGVHPRSNATNTSTPTTPRELPHRLAPFGPPTLRATPRLHLKVRRATLGLRFGRDLAHSLSGASVGRLDE